METSTIENELKRLKETRVQEKDLQGMSAFITGCTAGIGLATTIDLLREGVNVTGVGRRKDRLKAIAEFAEHEKLTGVFEAIAADCSTTEFISNLRGRPRVLQSDILICNAGLARGLDPVAKASPADWQEMISTNLTSVFSLIHVFLPLMIASGKGTIVGLGSIAGHISYENGSVYCATKHALRSFFQALRQETCGQNIRVGMISPGMVETAFSEVRFHGDKERAKSVYAGVTALTPQDVAHQILHFLKQPDHVNIDDLILMPVQQASPFKVARRNS